MANIIQKYVNEIGCISISEFTIINYQTCQEHAIKVFVIIVICLLNVFLSNWTIVMDELEGIDVDVQSYKIQ